jgi:hypothetical protein
VREVDIMLTIFKVTLIDVCKDRHFSNSESYSKGGKDA